MEDKKKRRWMLAGAFAAGVVAAIALMVLFNVGIGDKAFVSYTEYENAMQMADKYAELESLYTFLQDNYYPYGDYALVGTKGHCFEGPFYLNRRGQIIGWSEENEKRSEKLVARETERLRTSFEAAKRDGFRRFIMFLHFPPTSILEDDSPFTRMAEEYGAEQVIYAHSHGESRFYDSIHGEKNGIRYSLVSGDFLHWDPLRIL